MLGAYGEWWSQNPIKSSTHGEPKDPFYIYVWDHFGFHFLSLFVTISATTCFSKIRTAPTREHDFRGCSLPKNTNFGTLFRSIFRTFCRPPSGTQFLKPRMLLWSPTAGFWDPFGSTTVRDHHKNVQCQFGCPEALW